MAKQVCSWCGRDRKQKHYSQGGPDCDDCLNQQANGRLAGSGPNPYSNQGLPPQIQALFSPGGGLIGAGSPTGPLPFAPPIPPEDKPKRKKKEPTGPVYKSVSEVATFDFSGDVKKIELQLEFGMNEQGRPLTEGERTDLQEQYARMTFQSEAEVDETEEQEALKSILGE